MTPGSDNPFDILPPPPHTGTNQPWLLSFSVLMSILLAFFVMLFSMSHMQTQAWRTIVKGLSDELSPGRERAILELEKDARPERLREPKGIDLGYLEAVIREKFRNHPVLANARVHSRPDRVVISLPVDLLFEPEKALATANAPAALQAIGQSLASIKNRIEVHVYTADGSRTALSGPEGYGSAWELSLRRALIIKQLFLKSGLDQPVIPAGHSLPVTVSGPAGDLVELVIRAMGT
jgi:chemotaxis protein MotB